MGRKISIVGINNLYHQWSLGVKFYLYAPAASLILEMNQAVRRYVSHVVLAQITGRRNDQREIINSTINESKELYGKI